MLFVTIYTTMSKSMSLGPETTSIYIPPAQCKDPDEKRKFYESLLIQYISK